MSWIEQIETGMIITTGDGKTYEPEYINTPKSYGFNISEFEFPEITGTLVNRKRRKGIRYDLEIYFQGENHLDVAAAFELSTLDERPWVISHPMHGKLTMQPASIAFDNTGINTSKINAQMIETITSEAPRVTVDPAAQAQLDVDNFNDTAADNFAGTVDENAEVSDTNLLTTNVTELYSDADGVVTDPTQAQDYFNLFNTATTSLLAYTSDPLRAITAVQDVINYPSLFLVSVQDRLRLLVNQFNTLINGIEQLLTPNEKTIFENNAGMVIGSMVNTTLNPFDSNDFANTTDVIAAIDVIIDNYNEYLFQLDYLQTDNGGDTDSYIPNQSTLLGLSNLVNSTVSQLFDIALSAQQERKIILEDDSNLINLTHRLYGLVPNDSKIDDFIRNNKIGLSEILQIKKGREIVYYV